MMGSRKVFDGCARCLSVLVALCAWVAAGTGCQPGEKPAQLDAAITPRVPGEFVARPPHSRSVPVTSEGSEHPVRLTQELFEKAPPGASEPLELPFEGFKFVPRRMMVFRRDGALVAQPNPVPEPYLHLALPVNIDSSGYNALEIRMRTQNSRRCYVSWAGELTEESTPLLPAPVHFPIFPGEEMRDYRVSLRDPLQKWWQGRIKELHLFPSWAPEEVVIERLALCFAPPEAAPRHTLDGQTQETLYGSQAPWTVHVPAAGRLSVCRGTNYNAGMPGTGRVKFRVSVVDKTGEEKELDTQGMVSMGNEPWRRLAAPLDQWAGEKVQINLQVDNLRLTRWDFPLWGTPMVYSAKHFDDAIPVILISIDTLRADHTGCYGYERNTTPFLDEFAEEAVLFENAYADTPWTLPSHMTMMTGRHSHEHGVGAATRLPESEITLAERLRDEGYITLGFTGHYWWLMDRWGFGQGFDFYKSGLEGHLLEPITRTVRLAQDWLSDYPTNRLFLFFHSYEAHAKVEVDGYTLPYVPSDRSYVNFADGMPFGRFDRLGDDLPAGSEFLIQADETQPTEEEIEYMKAMYDDSIVLSDDYTRRLMAFLKSQNLYENALIIVLSDHGESFGENGMFLHKQLHESCVHIPLLVRFPGGEFGGQRVRGLVTTADLYATVLDVLGLPLPEDRDSRSLRAIAAGEASGREEVFYTFTSNQQGIRRGPWKLIHVLKDNTYHLFNLAEDPGELTEVTAKHPETAAELRERLEMFFRPDSGWTFDFLNNGPETSVLVSLARPSGLKPSSGVMDKLDLVTVSPDGLSAHADITLWEDDRDILMADAAPEPMDVVISRTDEGTLTVLPGAKESLEGTEISLTLDPSDEAWLEEPSLDAANELATSVRIWYTPPKRPRGEAIDLTEEDKATIEAIGYAP